MNQDVKEFEFDPLVDPVDNAFGITRAVLAQIQRDYGRSLQELAEFDFVTLLVSLQPGLSQHQTEAGHHYYTIDEEVGDILYDYGRAVPEAAEIVKRFARRTFLPVPNYQAD